MIPKYKHYSNEINNLNKHKLGFDWVQEPAIFSNGFSIAFFIRMLYSALVDADFLDTERFLDKEKSLGRIGLIPIESLVKRLQVSIESKFKNVHKSNVNIMHQQILEHCNRMADLPKGIFTLTVPTGGGKTITSLSFALRHAAYHKIDRVIYVIYHIQASLNRMRKCFVRRLEKK